MDMIVHPNIGLRNIRFGQTTSQVVTRIGDPDEALENEVDRQVEAVWHYWSRGLSVSFASFDVLRLIEIEVDHPEATLDGQRLIGATVDVVLTYVRSHNLGAPSVGRFPSRVLWRFEAKGLWLWFADDRLDSIQLSPNNEKIRHLFGDHHVPQ